MTLVISLIFWMSPNLRSPIRTILFHRDFRTYTGGHQKVADYFEHALSFASLKPSISFSEHTVFDSTNPWFSNLSNIQIADEFTPSAFDICFLAGVDWRQYIPLSFGKSQPVINLIQHVRHGEKGQDVYPFLSERAIRICVSKEVEESILATGLVNGPVFTIANGHGISHAPKNKLRDVYILATKNPEVGMQLKSLLEVSGISVELTVHQSAREDILEFMSTSKVTVTLPNKTEGFYLPALEAMSLSDIAIVPDCVGNRSFCFDNKNCLMPEYHVEAIRGSVLNALDLLKPSIGNQYRSWRRKRNVQKTMKTHSLENERKAFHNIIKNLDQIW